MEKHTATGQWCGHENKTALFRAMQREATFTAEELAAVIEREFTDDANPLDALLVDMAIRRLMELEGAEPTIEALHARYTQIAHHYLRRSLDLE